MARPHYPAAYWPASGTTSGAVKLEGNQVIGFITPSSLNSTMITFKMATDINNPIWVPINNSSGSAISFTVAASGYYGFTADQICGFYGIEYIQVVGGSSESAKTLLQLAVCER